MRSNEAYNHLYYLDDSESNTCLSEILQNSHFDEITDGTAAANGVDGHINIR